MRSGRWRSICKRGLLGKSIIVQGRIVIYAPAASIGNPLFAIFEMELFIF